MFAIFFAELTTFITKALNQRLISKRLRMFRGDK